MSKAAIRNTVAKSDAPGHSSQADQQPRKVRILLAEDNSVNQLVAVGLLRKLGYGADIVGDGLAALDARKLTPYDIIFMDCQMPEMDGYDAARAIRALEQCSDQGDASIRSSIPASRRSSTGPSTWSSFCQVAWVPSWAKTDAHTRVLNADGDAIPGLYAADADM